MKKKFKGVWAVSLALVLVITLSLGMIMPAAAADYPENDWDTWGLPAVAPGTNIGPMAVAPDGTIYAAVLDSTWKVMKSEDGGFTWDATTLTDADGIISQIVVSDNYAQDETIYVGVYQDSGSDPQIYRLEEAGDDNPIAIRLIPGSPGVLYSIDTWYDGDDNWILAGTDSGVYEIKDAHSGFWIDYQLVGSHGAPRPGYEVNYAPDFDDSQLIWAVTRIYGHGTVDDNFLVTSTVAPGQWGQVIEPADIDGSDATFWLDIAFPDDYSSDVSDEVPIVFLAVTDGSTDINSGVYMIECVAGDGNPATYTSEETGLMTGTDMVSLDISGEVILAGELTTPTVHRSDDLGASWSAATKSPTGDSSYAWTHVVMAPGAFDPDDGVAYAATWGDESAISRSDNGGTIWNQIGLIDTTINDIWDLAFHPDFPSTPTLLMITDDGLGAYSLWLTENGDSDAPDYQRVLCGVSGGPAPGNFNGDFWVVEFTSDGDTILLGGNDPADRIWKSTNDGQTFASPRGVGGTINDIASPDGSTLLVATDNGLFRSINKGLSWSNPITADAWRVILAPDDEDAVLVGGQGNGKVSLSVNGGATFTTATPLSGNVVVAFGPGFADGEGAIYAASDGSDEIMVGDEDGDKAFNFKALKDDTNDQAVAGQFYGLAVSADNALYAVSVAAGASTGGTTASGTVNIQGALSTLVASFPVSLLTPLTPTSGTFINGEVLNVIGSALTIEGTQITIIGSFTVQGAASSAIGSITVPTGTPITGPAFSPLEAVNVTGSSLTAAVTGGTTGTSTGLYRLLLGADDSLWETATDTALGDPRGAWLTPGSNVIWTIEPDALWAISDTLSGQVTLDSPANGFRSESEDTQPLSWNALTDADEYEYSCDGTGTTSKTSKTITGLANGTEYSWKVRVAPGEPWSSRWSNSRTFYTALGSPSWAPTPYAPGNGATGVGLLPAFSWETAETADGYQFQLNDSPTFATLVDVELTTEAYQVTTELDYSTTYYWRVRALKGDVAISRWSEVSVFTTMAEPVATTTTPPLTVTQPAPPTVILPTPIPPALLWTIIGIGAALIITVIVLIVRTRRAA